MTHPIQVVSVPGIGEELSKALSPMVEAYQRRQQLELQQQELKLRQQQMKMAEQERAAQQAQLGAAGEMLRSSLIAQDQQQVEMPQFPSVPSPTGMGNAFTNVEAGKQVTGYGPIAQAVRNAPAVAIPQFASLSQDIRAQLIKQRETREAATMVDRAIAARTDPAERESLQQYVAFKNGGVDLPVAAQQALFPKLFPQGVDPQIATAMLRFGVAGGLTWGQIRSQFGQASMPGGIPDDFRFPITTGAGAQKQTERQMVAQFHYNGMAFSGPLIDKLVYGYVDDQGNQHAGSGGLSEPALIKRAFDQATASGNTVTQFIGVLGQIGGNRLLSPEQRQLIDATNKFSNSLRYLMTGAQSNAQEFQIILNSISEWQTDDPATKAQKAAYRQVMTEAARQLAEGRTTREAAASRLVTQAQAMGLPPDFQATMKQWQSETGGPDNVPLYGRDPSQQMSNEELLDAINRTLEGGARKNFIMGPQP